MYDRHLAKSPLDYPKMIFENQDTIIRQAENVDWNKLRYDVIDNNLIFNYVDYLLWASGVFKDKRVIEFAYKFRSSVEHYFPQTPKNKDLEPLTPLYLHSFGNLCLISHEKNSSLSNDSPIAKKDHYSSFDSIDSIKQFVMMQQLNWTEKEIVIHEKEMFDLLVLNLNSNYKKKSDISKALKWFKETSINNRNLLARTLLCFDDYSVEVGRNKYNFFDFDEFRNSTAFKLYEDYVLQNNPKSLADVIEEKLKSEDLVKSYRYLFIKYPEVIEYCKAGNFNWFDDTEDNLIYLLESLNNTKNVSVELYTYLIKIIFKKEFDLDIYINNEGLFIYIGFQDNEYYISSYNDALVQLHVWNNGIGLSHCLNDEVPNKRSRNYQGLKLLEDYKWIFTEDAYYRFGKSELFKFESNVMTNLENSLNSLKSILKNGFKIKF